MNPAPSVIFFTTASGAGYGLLFISALLLAAGHFPGEPATAITAVLLAFALIAAGLLSSTLHLGRPERAWRAFSQWRTSWLSREGVAAVLTVAAHLVLLWALWSGAGRPVIVAAALACALGSAVTVACTAMIYASLRAIRGWHDSLVLPVYLAMAAATGAVWLFALTLLAGDVPVSTGAAPVVLLAIAWALKLAYWRRSAHDDVASDINSATSLPGEVRPLDPPHTEANYLLNEMGFRIGRKHARKLRRLALIGGAALPAAMILTSAALPLFALVAAVAATLGVLVERWLFFAEARHTVTLYYG